ncbi:CRISPR-associated protein Cas4 [Polluticaenibacter yanchengensis]|uniref:CRISPR-associated exonuclease Cas4 n=1 Tax=Polluticaenibacter yanchengensis TaxID=3014562 RepID=A0ABT4UPP2_9BACT|nr:CRISPR-associated protein Cas4 [Chitinophagaceae bacterium LY-5]
MTINATLINLYNVCPRECWLHANGVRMEHTSDTVADGKLLHETSYADRNMKHSELSIEASFNRINLYGQIDFYDAKRKIIHETKRGNKVEEAHIWQVKFYLWLLKLNGIDSATGIIEYPLLRQTDTVELSIQDELHLQKLVEQVTNLQASENCPPVINGKICRNCSYYELCYINE